MATIEVCVKELRRELAMRHKVYPRWVAAGKLTQAQAEERVDVIKTVLALYEELQVLHGPQARLFKT